jgi:hypothetical protein
MHPQATLGASLNPRTWDNGGSILMNLTGRVLNYVARNQLGLDVLGGDAFLVSEEYADYLTQVCEMLSTEFAEQGGSHSHWILKWAETRLMLPLFEHLDQCRVLGFDKVPTNLEVRVVHYVRNPTNYRGTIAQFNPKLFDIYWGPETTEKQYERIANFLADKHDPPEFPKALWRTHPDHPHLSLDMWYREMIQEGGDHHKDAVRVLKYSMALGHTEIWVRRYMQQVKSP